MGATEKSWPKAKFVVLGQYAKGTIGPRPDQRERLDEFTCRVASGEFHVPIRAGVTIPVRCIDGRNIATGVSPLAPNAAGGTESIFVADDLTTKRFAGDDDSTVTGYRNTIAALRAASYEVGGHTDSHAHDSASGCGANDKLPEIYNYIARSGAVLREIAGTFGVPVSVATHRLIVKNAAARTQFSPGAALFAELEKQAQKEYVDHLDGEHNEVLVVVNKRTGTTLDRPKLMHEFGETYEAFNVDVWAFEEAAQATSQNTDEVQQKLAAMVYYNLATALVLGGRQLRVVTLQ